MKKIIVILLAAAAVISVSFLAFAQENRLAEKHHNKLVESGAPGAFLLGFIFALAFCPVSAA